MKIKVTSQDECICQMSEFKRALARCEAALASPAILCDSVNGMDRYIPVDMPEEDYIRVTIIKYYEAAGWKWVSDRFIGELRFVLPSAE